MSNDTAHVAVSGGSRPASSDLIATLLNRAPRVAVTVAGAQLVWPVAKRLYDKAKAESTYTVKVLDTDDIYDDLHEWVLGLLPTQKRRALVAWTAKRDSGHVLGPVDGAPTPPPRLRLRYDGSQLQTITLGGHDIKVEVSEAGEPGKSGRVWKPAEIVFTASSLAAQQHLLGEISEVARRSRETHRKPLFRMLARWGDWQRLDDLPARDLDSVILPAGQLEKLVADVKGFLDAEELYSRRCMPWHRAHLYEGPPGTGKTSVARAIASHFGMDVWYLPLGDLRKDGDLLSVVNQVSPRSMLLLEDIDVFHATKKRDDEDDGVTLSGLLNALDGVATPHGLFRVLTTNDPAVLDDAVIRPGRVDLVEHFGLADSRQVARLMARWYGHPVEAAAGLSGVSPAAVVEACKSHEEPSAALSALQRQLEAV